MWVDPTPLAFEMPTSMASIQAEECRHKPDDKGGSSTGRADETKKRNIFVHVRAVRMGSGIMLQKSMTDDRQGRARVDSFLAQLPTNEKISFHVKIRRYMEADRSNLRAQLLAAPS